MKSRRLNLIPSNMLMKSPIKMDAALMAAALAITLVLTTHGAWQFHKLKDLRAILAEKQNFAAELSQQAQKLVLLNSKNAARAAVGNGPTLDEQLPWADIFKELSILIPNRTWLTNLSMKNNSGKPIVSLDGEADSQITMSSFFSNLEKSYYFSQIKMIFSERQSDFMPAIYKFSFSTETKAAPISSKGDKK